MADFSDEEWKSMQVGAAGAGMFVALTEAGIKGSLTAFKEGRAISRYLREVHEHSQNALIRDLSAERADPFRVRDSREMRERATLVALHQAVAVLELKSPEDLPAYRQFVLGVAQSVAKTAKVVSPGRKQALGIIRAALGASN